MNNGLSEKFRITCLILISTFVAPLVFAGSEHDRQLAELTAQRDKAIAEASEPINHRYQIALQDLLRKATMANDVEAAVKIKAALTAADPNGSELVPFDRAHSAFSLTPLSP